MSAPSSRLALVICAGFLALLGCSKTQDTAPETRVFGAPPQIATVDVTTTVPDAVAMADFSNFFLASRNLCDDSPMLIAPVMVQSTYTEVTLKTRVTDPDDPPPPSTETDVLLVAASYTTGSGGGTPQEDTIVLFDDGSQVPFPFGQRDTQGLQECAGIVDNHCACTKAFYDVTSNDPTAGDDVFTRIFAFAPIGALPPNLDGLYLDTIAKGRGQAPAVSRDSAGTTRQFRFEAVDRSGNLTEWPNRPSAVIGNGSISCSGDPCACCLMLNTVNPGDDVANGGCKGLQGLHFDSSAPKRCEPFTQDNPSLPNYLRMRDPNKTYDLCSTNADCCSLGKVCDTNNPNADYLTGGCLQSAFARRCSAGLCISPNCLNVQ